MKKKRKESLCVFGTFFEPVSSKNHLTILQIIFQPFGQYLRILFFFDYLDTVKEQKFYKGTPLHWAAMGGKTYFLNFFSLFVVSSVFLFFFLPSFCVWVFFLGSFLILSIGQLWEVKAIFLFFIFRLSFLSFIPALFPSVFSSFLIHSLFLSFLISVLPSFLPSFFLLLFLVLFVFVFLWCF